MHSSTSINVLNHFYSITTNERKIVMMSSKFMKMSYRKKKKSLTNSESLKGLQFYPPFIVLTTIILFNMLLSSTLYGVLDYFS